MHIWSFVLCQHVLVSHWLAQQHNSACGCEWAALLGHADKGCPRYFFRSEKLYFHEIYACVRGSHKCATLLVFIWGFICVSGNNENFS